MGARLVATLLDRSVFDHLLNASGTSGGDRFDASATLRLTLVYAPGDVNFDGVVNIFDINLVSQH